MNRFLADEIANQYGSWAQLCDPQFAPSPQLYADFEAGGVSAARLDEIRVEQCMPARQRAFLDIADDLLRAWSRYLFESPDKSKNAFSGVFVDLPLPRFWNEHRSLIRDHEITNDEIESFIAQIKSSEGTPLATAYVESRAQKIRTLAKLCQDYPPPASAGGSPPPDTGGPDLDPSLVPLHTGPTAGGAALALKQPEPEDGVVRFRE